jgi:hypothetical protein
VRTYQHVSIPIDVLAGVEELAAVRYANEQCAASPGIIIKIHFNSDPIIGS